MSPPSQLLPILPLLYTAGCNLVASTTLFVWDTLLVFDEEVKYIWSNFKFTRVKILYLMVRYLVLGIYCMMIFAFLGSPTKFNKLCPALMWIVLFGGSFTIACSNILLIQRVYAFYVRSKFILWSLSLLFIIIEIVAIIFLGVSVPGFRVRDTRGDHLPAPFGACMIEQFDGRISFVFFSELVFQSFAFVCVAARFARLQFWAWKTRVPYSPLYADFFRDGIWVFIILFLTFLLTGIYMHTSFAPALSVAIWSYVFSSICCTRLILNLNHSVKESRNYSDL